MKNKHIFGLLLAVLLLFGCTPAMAASSVAIYKEQGGAKQVVGSGGEIEVQSGATLDIQSGATFTVADGSLAAGDVALAEGNVLVGNASGNAVALNGKADGKIMVGNGTTITSVAVSGDMTLTNAGVTAIGTGKVTSTMILDGTVAVVDLANAVQDYLPKLALLGANDADGTGSMSIQLQDAAGNTLAGRALVRVWTSGTQYGAPSALTGFTASTGTAVATVTANADLDVITDTNGVVVADINNGAPGTIWVMAELNGLVYSASIAITGP